MNKQEMLQIFLKHWPERGYSGVREHIPTMTRGRRITLLTAMESR